MNTEFFSRVRGGMVVAALLAGGAGWAAEAPAEIVTRLDAVRLKAMGAGDGAALGKILSDEIIFIHSDARSESKADYIKNLTAGDTAYTDLKTANLKPRQIAADVVVLTGAQEMKKKLGATWTEIKLNFLSVWRNEGGTWRMIAWQSMRPSGTSVVPPK